MTTHLRESQNPGPGRQPSRRYACASTHVSRQGRRPRAHAPQVPRACDHAAPDGDGDARVSPSSLAQRGLAPCLESCAPPCGAPEPDFAGAGAGSPASSSARRRPYRCVRCEAISLSLSLSLSLWRDAPPASFRTPGKALGRGPRRCPRSPRAGSRAPWLRSWGGAAPLPPGAERDAAGDAKGRRGEATHGEARRPHPADGERAQRSTPRRGSREILQNGEWPQIKARANRVRQITRFHGRVATNSPSRCRLTRGEPQPRDTTCQAFGLREGATGSGQPTRRRAMPSLAGPWQGKPPRGSTKSTDLLR